MCSFQCWRQCFAGIFGAIGLVIYSIVLVTCLFNRVDAQAIEGWCSFCDEINCLPTPWWDCDADNIACQPVEGSERYLPPTTPPRPEFTNLETVNITCSDLSQHYIADAEQYVDLDASKAANQLMLSTKICLKACTSA